MAPGAALVLALALAACGKARDGAAGAPPEVLVAGASDLVFVMEEIIPAFEQETGVRVKFTPGSSGKLAAQIREGAPFDAYLSANVKFVDQVVAAGACDGTTSAAYARGYLALWAGPDGAPPLPEDLRGLAAPAFRRIAIANPEHAPYGLAAKQALEASGVWAEVQPRVVFGANVKDAMQFADTGNAEVAIIALALVVNSAAPYVKVPEALHAPIEQSLVACTRGRNPDAGRRFVQLVRGPAMRAVLMRHGFAVPEH